MRTFEISGFYGTNNRCTIFTIEKDGGTWYAVEGSTNVNFTDIEVHDGINVEELNDLDYFSADNPIESLEDLEKELNDYENGEEEE